MVGARYSRLKSSGSQIKPQNKIIAEQLRAGRNWADHHVKFLNDNSTHVVNSLAFSNNDRMLASGGSQDHTVKLWNVASGVLLKTFTGHTGKVHQVLFSPDNKVVASASQDKTIRLWDTRTGKLTRTLRLVAPRRMRFSEDGKAIVCASLTIDGLDSWSIKTGAMRRIRMTRLPRPLKDIHLERVPDITGLTPDAENYAPSPDGRFMYIYDGRRRAFTQDHTLFAASGYTQIGKSLPRLNVVKIWNVRTRRLLRLVPLGSAPTHADVLAFSTRSNMLAVGSNGIEIWQWN
jgi:WD40 repeat protein